ncbi:hypothetical protein CAPTEDRAFT_118853 [Capitella teleta]|uniref:PRA1 family protein n=1 Tax=Capitella teleta TaxID=283909 RepID=R7U3Z4_CAPTE|nr:hypothetical protein CAPTEDRAFT_118853 [Capitella teleta]|eukprot:ELU00704.1 hypothetical protein CAPTEDRAFT_118853 [Capitella teleta]
MDNLEIAPLRNLNDFLWTSARFQVPDVKDPTRWANRVINNLLYYQTNYFISAIIIFVLVGLLHPVQMMFGIASCVAAFSLFVYTSNNQTQFRRFKRQHPGVSMVIVCLMGYLLIYLFGSVLVFFFGIALPLAMIFVHSSLRLRNVKNKVMNKLEYVGIKRTPMGLFLEALGQEQEGGS